MKLGEIARIRLEQLGIGAIEAAVSAKLERAFIRDLVEGRKKTVRADKLPDLARALKLDAQALSRGDIVPAGLMDPEAEEVLQIMARLPEDARDQLLGRARSLDLQHRVSEHPSEAPAKPREEGG